MAAVGHKLPFANDGFTQPLLAGVARCAALSAAGRGVLGAPPRSAGAAHGRWDQTTHTL